MITRKAKAWIQITRNNLYPKHWLKWSTKRGRTTKDSAGNLNQTFTNEHRQRQWAPRAPRKCFGFHKCLAGIPLSKYSLFKTYDNAFVTFINV